MHLLKIFKNCFFLVRTDNVPLRPSNFTTLFHFSEYFTRESNRNRTLLFHPPSNTKRVLLEAIITGHGEDSKTGTE